MGASALLLVATAIRAEEPLPSAGGGLGPGLGIDGEPSDAPEAERRPIGFELGLGLRSVEGGASSDTLSFAARLATVAGLAAEVNVGLRAPFVDPVTSLDRTLLDIAYQGDPNTSFQVPIDVDVLVLGVAGDWGFIPRVAAGKFTGGPRLHGGVELRVQELYVAGVSAAYRNGEAGDPVELSTNPTTRVVPAVVGGGGVDAWYAGRVGLRVRWLGGTYLAEEPDYGNVDPQTGASVALETKLYTDFHVVTDVLVAF